jgi:hypothetical protein
MACALLIARWPFALVVTGPARKLMPGDGFERPAIMLAARFRASRGPQTRHRALSVIACGRGRQKNRIAFAKRSYATRRGPRVAARLPHTRGGKSDRFSAVAVYLASRGPQ